MPEQKEQDASDPGEREGKQKSPFSPLAEDTSLADCVTVDGTDSTIYSSFESRTSSTSLMSQLRPLNPRTEEVILENIKHFIFYAASFVERRNGEAAGLGTTSSSKEPFCSRSARSIGVEATGQSLASVLPSSLSPAQSPSAYLSLGYLPFSSALSRCK